jgi:hypothetical protein
MGKKSRMKRSRSTAGGSVFVPIDEETNKALVKQLSAFRERFGRDPGPDDPVFFNPDEDTPEPVTSAQLDDLDHKMIEAMVEVGIPADVIYAYKKIGRIVTQENEHLLSEQDREEWSDALDEYKRLSKLQRA